MSKKLKQSDEYAPIFNRLIEVCDKKNITVSQLLDKFTTSRSAIGAWKKGNINADTVGKIADYLSTSLEYLIYGEEKESENERTTNNILFTNKIEEEAFHLFQKLSEYEQIKLIGRMETLLEDYEKANSEEATG